MGIGGSAAIQQHGRSRSSRRSSSGRWPKQQRSRSKQIRWLWWCGKGRRSPGPAGEAWASCRRCVPLPAAACLQPLFSFIRLLHKHAVEGQVGSRCIGRTCETLQNLHQSSPAWPWPRNCPPARPPAPCCCSSGLGAAPCGSQAPCRSCWRQRGTDGAAARAGRAAAARRGPPPSPPARTTRRTAPFTPPPPRRSCGRRCPAHPLSWCWEISGCRCASPPGGAMRRLPSRWVLAGPPPPGPTLCWLACQLRAHLLVSLRPHLEARAHRCWQGALLQRRVRGPRGKGASSRRRWQAPTGCCMPPPLHLPPLRLAPTVFEPAPAGDGDRHRRHR